MSHKEKMAELRQQLERWRSHNEVHAKPADKMLYDFLSDLLKIGEDEPQQPAEATAEDIAVQQAETAANDDPPGEGGNSPEGAPDLP